MGNLDEEREKRKVSLNLIKDKEPVITGSFPMYKELRSPPNSSFAVRNLPGALGQALTFGAICKLVLRLFSV